MPKADHAVARRLPEGGHAGAAPARIDQLLVEHRSLRRQPAQGVLRRRGDRGERIRLRLPPEASANRSGDVRELELGLHLRPDVPRRDGRLVQLRDEPGQQRAALAQGDRRAREAEMAGRRRELRAGDGRVLAARHPGARRPEDRGCRDRGLPAAGGELRREGRLVRELGALDPVEVEGDRSAGRREAGSGNRRAHLPEGARALRTGGRRVSGSGSQSELVVHERVEPVARRGLQGAERVGAAGRSRRERATSCCAPASSCRGFSTRAPTARRSRATGSTSACTPTPATSRSGDRPPIRAGSAAIPNGRSAGPPTGASCTTALGRRGGAAVGCHRASASPGTASAGSATRPTTRSTAGPRRISARSSCCRKASRGCSCRDSSSTDRGRSTTSRPNRRCRTRCIPRRAPTPRCSPSAPSSTFSGRPTNTRSCAPPIG